MTVKVLMTCNVQLYKTLKREFASKAVTSHFYDYCITKANLESKDKLNISGFLYKMLVWEGWMGQLVSVMTLPMVF